MAVHKLLRSIAVPAALTLGIAAMIPSLTVVAADAPPAASPQVEEGFTSLFNGKDLTGWIYGKVKKKDGTEGENKAGQGYQIIDGAICSTKADGGNLYTEKEYANFVLRFEFKLTPNANNGIGIRAPLTGDSAYQGMEIQVLDDTGSAYWDAAANKPKLRPAQYHGSVYDVFPVERGHQKPVGEWNVQEIMADGSHIKVTLNGTVILDVDLATVKDEAVLKKHPGLKNEKGHIGFLGHGAEVAFRNLRVKELK